VQRLSEEEQEGPTKERSRVRAFIKDYTRFLSPNLVLAFINDSGQSWLLLDAFLAFKMYDYAAVLCVSLGLFRQVPQLVAQIDADLQQNVFFGWSDGDPLGCVDYLLEKRDTLTLPAVADVFAQLCLISNREKIGDEVKAKTLTLFNAWHDDKRFVEREHLHMYFIALVSLAEKDAITTFVKSPEFELLDKDFIVPFLIHEKYFALAAEIYATHPDRHSLAVKYALADSVEQAMDLLKTSLKDAHDAAALWDQLLDTCAKWANADPQRPIPWPALVADANHYGNLSLDQIFRILPKTLEITSLDRTIAAGVKDAAAQIKASEELTEEVAQRAEEERRLVKDQVSRSMEVDQNEALCFFCGQQALDAGFILYPCTHVIHIACGRNEYPHGGNLSPEVLRESCPACGIAALKIMESPFIDPANERQEFAKWAVPF
jgi:hypothetical protein